MQKDKIGPIQRKIKNVSCYKEQDALSGGLVVSPGA
jgi:hypothetical protein